jgi:hypothetical protein
VRLERDELTFKREVAARGWAWLREAKISAVVMKRYLQSSVPDQQIFFTDLDLDSRIHNPELWIRNREAKKIADTDTACILGQLKYYRYLSMLSK